MSLRSGLLLMLLAAVLGLTGLAFHVAGTSWQQRPAFAGTVKQTKLAELTGGLIHEVQKEKGGTAGFLASIGAISAAHCTGWLRSAQ